MTHRILLGLVALVALAGPARAQTTTVELDGIPRQIPVVERQGRRFVALASVAALLGGRVEESRAEEATLVVDDVRLVVHRRIPFVESSGRWYQLTEPVQKDAGGFYLPASSLELLLPHLWPGRFQAAPPPAGTVRPEVREPTEQSQGPERLESAERSAVDFRIEPGRTRLAFHTPRTPGVEVDDSRAGTLRILLTGVELPTEMAGGLVDLGLVDSVGLVAEEGSTELTLWLDPAARVYAVAPLRRPTGLEVVLLDAAVDEAVALLDVDARRGRRDDLARGGQAAARPVRRDPPPTPRAPDPAPGGLSPTPRAPEPTPRESDGRSGQWVVVVDAGHGGHDPGARGRDGSDEKDVTLAVALALRDALGAREGLEVILTREDDTFVALGRRARIANEARADVFVSIHANAATHSSAEGFETYFLSAAVTEEARRLAQRENASLRYETDAIDPSSLDDVNLILWDLAQNEYLRESSVLAETIQEELGRRISLKSRGVKQAPLYVLKGAFMPAVLFETAFISNPREEELLNDTAFQSRLAEGLAASLVAYLDRYGRKVGPATAAR
ncbi:MAG: N-acetylmuramoyl-L-alanine amidase [Gemmatimonadota bacterium]